MMWGPIMRRVSPFFLVLLVAGFALMDGPASAQDQALVSTKQDCPPDEPDSVQINWDTPCEIGTWLFDPEAGCRLWDWHPDPQDAATWTGACPAGLKEGKGVVQWFEHGKRIDRFEGTYHAGQRQGFGRYAWNETDRYEGNYEDDLPHGVGTAYLAGAVVTGQWKGGCLKSDDKVVAIGVARSSCIGLDGPPVPELRQASSR